MEKLKLGLRSLYLTVCFTGLAAVCYGMVFLAIFLDDRYGIWFMVPVVLFVVWGLITVILWDEKH